MPAALDRIFRIFLGLIFHFLTAKIYEMRETWVDASFQTTEDTEYTEGFLGMIVQTTGMRS